MLCRAKLSSVSQVGLDAATDSVLFFPTGGVSFCSGVDRARGSFGEPKVTPPFLVYTLSDVTSHVVHLAKPAASHRQALFVDSTELFALNENRELGSHISPLPSETPSDVIKRRAEIIENIPDDHKKPSGRRMSMNELRAVCARWNILLSDNLVWVDCQEGFNGIVEGLQVFVCPDELHEKAGYCRHDLRS